MVLRSADPEFFIAHADLDLIKALPRDPQPVPDRARLLPRARRALAHAAAGDDRPDRGPCPRRRQRARALARPALRRDRARACSAQPEVAIGIIPGGGGTQRLGRLLGRGRALEVVLGCDDFDAETAERYGWVNRALPADEIGPFVDRLARRIASFPPDAVRLAKQAVDAALPSPRDGLLAEAHAWNQVLTDPELDARFDAALAAGAQTREGELDLTAPPRRPRDASANSGAR